MPRLTRSQAAAAAVPVVVQEPIAEIPAWTCEPFRGNFRPSVHSWPQQATDYENHKIYVFGGLERPRVRVSQDLVCLDSETMTWEKLTGRLHYQPPHARKYKKLLPDLFQPAVTFAKLPCAEGIKRCLLIFGGHHDDGMVEAVTSRLIVLDLDKLMWEYAILQGPPPKNRMGACIVPTSGNKFYIFGGRDSNEINGSWDNTVPLNSYTVLEYHQGFWRCEASEVQFPTDPQSGQPVFELYRDIQGVSFDIGAPSDAILLLPDRQEKNGSIKMRGKVVVFFTHTQTFEIVHGIDNTFPQDEELNITGYQLHPIPHGPRPYILIACFLSDTRHLGPNNRRSDKSVELWKYYPHPNPSQPEVTCLNHQAGTLATQEILVDNTFVHLRQQQDGSVRPEFYMMGWTPQPDDVEVELDPDQHVENDMDCIIKNGVKDDSDKPSPPKWLEIFMRLPL